MSKDYTKMTVAEAVNIVDTKYHFDNTRSRIQSKAIAYILRHTLTDAAQYTISLETKIKELEDKIDELSGKV